MTPSPMQSTSPDSERPAPKAGTAVPDGERRVPDGERRVPDGEKSAINAELPTRTAHAALRYTTFRLAIFVVVLGLLWLVRVRGALLVALALIVSGLASYVLLRGQRDAMSMQLASATQRRHRRSAKRAAREDEIADELIDEQTQRDS
jgi:hypothetical protein